MKKELIIAVCSFTVMAVLTACGPAVTGKTEGSSAQTMELENQKTSASVIHNPMGNSHKILIAYFTYPENTDAKAIHSDKYDIMASASLNNKEGKAVGNNAVLATYIANKTGADTVSILTEKNYPESYDETVAQGKQEIENNELPALQTHVTDLSGYDTVILIYPNWWGTLPAPVQSFLHDTNLSGKSIYAVVTSGGSGFSDTIQLIQQLEPGASVKEGFALHHNDMADAEGAAQKWLETTGWLK